MSFARGLFFLIILSCIIASMYLFFPHAKSTQQHSKAQETLSPLDFSFQVELQKGNLVQFFKGIDHTFHYKHIKLEEQSLFIDFRTSANAWDKDTVFHDAYEVISHVYLYTNNVDKLYIRFFSELPERQELLCYIFAEREHFKVEDIINKKTDSDAKSIILERTELTYGIGWRN